MGWVVHVRVTNSIEWVTNDKHATARFATNKNQFQRKNRCSTSLNLWCYNGAIIQWGILRYRNLFSFVWYSEKLSGTWSALAVAIRLCMWGDRELQFLKPCVIFRIAENWQYISKVRVIPRVDYHANKSLLEVKRLNYSLHNVRAFLSNLIYQSSLVLLNCFLPPVNGSHLSTAARTLMIHPLLFAAWCLTTNNHPFWYNDFWRKFCALMSLVCFIKMVNVLLMIIIFS